MMDPQFECPGGTSEWRVVCTDQAVFRKNTVARGCASPRVPQSLHLLRVVDVLERDLSHPSHEVEDIGDVCDCTGVAVVQAVDAHSHQCARVAEFAEVQTRRPSRWLVLVETQHDGVEFDSDTDTVVGVYDDEDPPQRTFEGTTTMRTLLFQKSAWQFRQSFPTWSC